MPFKRPDSKYWYILVNGVPKSSRTTVFKDAEALEAKHKADAWREKHMEVPAPKKTHSWEDAVTLYAKKRSHKLSWDDDVYRIRWLHPHLGHVTDVGTITRKFLNALMQKHRGAQEDRPSSQNNTANHFVALVSAVLQVAAEEWDDEFAVPKFVRYPIPPVSLHCWFKPKEWLALEAVLPEHHRLPAKFALATGLRRGKVFGLTWEQIDWDERTLWTIGTENKQGVYIPLNQTAMSILEQCRAGTVRHPKFVFLADGEPMKTIWQPMWKTYQERAGIRYRKFHALRHTFNSWLAQKSCPAEVRKRLCGWAGSSEIIDIYTHLDVEHLRPWTALIDSILSRAESSDAQNHTVSPTVSEAKKLTA